MYECTATQALVISTMHSYIVFHVTVPSDRGETGGSNARPNHHNRDQLDTSADHNYLHEVPSAPPVWEGDYVNDQFTDYSGRESAEELRVR